MRDFILGDYYRIVYDKVPPELVARERRRQLAQDNHDRAPVRHAQIRRTK